MICSSAEDRFFYHVILPLTSHRHQATLLLASYTALPAHALPSTSHPPAPCAPGHLPSTGRDPAAARGHTFAESIPDRVKRSSACRRACAIAGSTHGGRADRDTSTVHQARGCSVASPERRPGRRGVSRRRIGETARAPPCRSGRRAPVPQRLVCALRRGVNRG